ncbi:excinuclease ABC subunit UvrB [Mycoplasmopsis caviae]|uniref:UvrABC system protein B n=1 Tax=Mycoplasmopsis caviae TaxID=55603 RepID=A0A3P8LIF8_9BACT|nr:excinuclease ABC subunit UvrB [Mycoplasmopsis caviae]UUD34974.1 excinuclease ABC subunit UvrB [Mycoplasmopsis caviae]VDR42202.1 UvrABC system protein B [Mycoplasmopsis caviae]
MSIYKLSSSYQPAGHQPQAISELVENIKANMKHQVLKGVTGSGKTFTIANVIKEFDRPVLVLSHNKTLASQLYSELKGFFPHNNVEYYVSYFDYYRPEAYIPSSDTYIDKVSQGNKELDAMRMSAMNSLMSRNDTIVVASVSAIYGALNPSEYYASVFVIEVGMQIKRDEFFKKLVQRNYKRNQIDLELGSFSSKGDAVYIQPAHSDQYLIRIDFFGDEIDSITTCHPLTKEIIEHHKQYTIFPGDAYTVDRSVINEACEKILEELEERIKYFESNNQLIEAQRIKERVEKDVDSLREFGICPGIENYARFMDRRKEGERPYTLLDYFSGKNPLLIIDESHMMIPQLNGMYAGDYSRKKNLVDYGFRLPSALDNRPLKFSEFESQFNFQTIYISATPDDYELNKTYGLLTKLYVRPTGLLDPKIEVRSSKNQVEDIFDELQKQKEKNERTLILTTTKRLSEELSRHYLERGQKIAYIHSEHNTFERNEILRKLRKGVYDCVIGINLLREGVDLPEVSLIIVLDADKEGFMRSTKSLIQISGRAARNANGRVIFYGDKVTKSMQECIEDNEIKRAMQIAYNKEHNIVPKTISKPIPEPLVGEGISGEIEFFFKNEKRNQSKSSKQAKEELIKKLREQMNQAAKELDYERAIELRDIILELQAGSNKVSNE